MPNQAGYQASPLQVSVLQKGISLCEKQTRA